MRRVFVNLLLAAVMLLLMLVLAEVGWRAFVSNGDRARAFDPELGRVNPKNAVWTIHTTEYRTQMETNSHGFRGPEFPTERKPHELRVLFLGDSFVEAKQVPIQERFAEETGRLIEKSLRRPVVVRALGVGGAEPAREFLYYDHLGVLFQPDIVVQVFFPENDLISMSGAYTFRSDHGVLTLEDAWAEAPPACHATCLVLQHSELALQAYRVLRGREQTAVPDVRSLLGDGQFYGYTAEGQNAFAQERRFDVLAAFADAVRTRVERQHGMYLAVLMPGAFEIESPWAQEIEKRYADRVPAAAWKPSGLLDRAAAALAKRGISVLDLRPAFRAAHAANGTLYYRGDPHLNPAGHRAAGAAIAQALPSMLR